MVSLSGLADLPGLALPLFGVRPAGLDALPQGQRDTAKNQQFRAAAGQCTLLTTDRGVTGALIGLGDEPAMFGFGTAASSLPTHAPWRIAPGDYANEDAALGFLLGAYRYQTLKTRDQKPRAVLLAGDVSSRTIVIVRAVCAARDLINTPPNLLGPEQLAQAIIEIGREFKADLKHITGETLTARYPAMAAVGAGSERAPHAVILNWRGSGANDTAPHISLCGKGVCFDTGGYDLKPSAAMLRMKKDMAGSAILLGVAQAVMALDLPIRLTLRVGCVENSISGKAMRPSDVLQTHAGLSVEVGNTDAEGRLVLCDLLAEAAKEKPTWLIDAATLTGAARVALGPDLPALFCNDDPMAQYILQAGIAQNDQLWRLPLHGGYTSWLDSPVADLNTVSSKPFAGAIIAALFLQHFVPKETPWAHIDVYGWNDATRAARPEGGEAQTLRALFTAIETMSNAKSTLA